MLEVCSCIIAIARSRKSPFLTTTLCFIHSTHKYISYHHHHPQVWLVASAWGVAGGVSITIDCYIVWLYFAAIGRETFYQSYAWGENSAPFLWLSHEPAGEDTM